jgi:hypothetical protein
MIYDPGRPHVEALFIWGLTAMMKSLPVAVLGVVFACAMHSAPARAQAARTFVSSTGSDSNNCANVATPCRHFAAAFAATSANGEIYVLDPANYGSLTITHSVSIQGHGWGSVAPPVSGNAVTINAPTTEDINLDGLTIDGTALSSTNGIVFTSGRSLTIENCVVRNVANSGLQFIPNVSAATTLSVSNSYFNNSSAGILIQPSSSGAVTAAIDHTSFDRDGGEGLDVNGVGSTGTIDVGVTDSVVSNSFIGIIAGSSSGHSVINLSLTHTLVVGNGGGVTAQGTNANVWLSQSTIASNGTGYNANTGGVINSFSDNYFPNNTNNSGILTGVTKQ